MERLRAWLLPWGLGWSLVFWALSIGAVLPIVSVAHPPLQDLPQHLAAISVLRNYPELGLGQHFELHLARTQYLAYYGLAWLLSFPLGVVLANKLLLSVSLIALPWSLAFLLRALGREPRAGVLAFGLTYNAHLVLGFFNFLAAIPLMFAGLTLAVRLRERWSWSRELGLAALLVLCFFTHVVPFAFLALGTGLIALGDSVRLSARRLRVFAPAALVFLGWLANTPAGKSTLAAAGGAEGTARASFNTFDQALRELPMWLTDVLVSESDDRLWKVWLALLAAACVCGVLGWFLNRRAPRDETDPPVRGLTWRVLVLCPLAAIAYFVAPTGYDWIWPISARFPLLSLLFACVLVPRLGRWYLQAPLLGASLLAAVSFVETERAFAAFDRDEVGEIDAALAVIPPAERVAGLIFNRGSRLVKFSPFLHYVSLYQAEKGGVVMFTFADFPQSPFGFREQDRPPRVRPRWEWMPERVNPARDLTWYSYVLVRGGPGQIARASSQWEQVFAGPQWRVYRRK